MNGQGQIGRWLLCDFHIHTQWSDGSEPLENVVDLYGASGFDAICITDHLIDSEFWRRHPQAQAIIPGEFNRYLEHLWGEARRAWDQYNMVLIPGTEVTNQTGGYHILALDVKQFIDPDNTVEEIIAEIHRQDGIAVPVIPTVGTPPTVKCPQDHAICGKIMNVMFRFSMPGKWPTGMIYLMRSV